MTAGGDQISLRQRRQFVLFGVDGPVRGDTPPTFFSVRSSHDSCPLQMGKRESASWALHAHVVVKPATLGGLVRRS